MMWKYNPTHDDLPKGKYDRTERKGPKGKTVSVEVFKPVKFLAVGKCGVLLITEVLEDGRLNFFATGELPRAWMEIPEVEAP